MFHEFKAPDADNVEVGPNADETITGYIVLTPEQAARTQMSMFLLWSYLTPVDLTIPLQPVVHGINWQPMIAPIPYASEGVYNAPFGPPVNAPQVDMHCSFPFDGKVEHPVCRTMPITFEPKGMPVVAIKFSPVATSPDFPAKLLATIEGIVVE